MSQVFGSPLKTASDGAVEISLTDMINKLCSYRSAKPVTFLMHTTCDTKMRKNDFTGKVEKVERLNVFINVSYTKMVQKKRDKGEMTDEDFVARPAFGLKVDDAFGEEVNIAPFIQCGIGIDDEENRVGLYYAVLPLQTARDEDGEREKHYEWIAGPQRGQRLTDDEVEELISHFYDPTGEKRRATSAACQQVKEEDVVGWIRPNVLSIKEIKMEGTLYRITDFTLPVIPENVVKAAVADVEHRRFVREQKQLIKKEHEDKIKEAMKAPGAVESEVFFIHTIDRFNEEVRQGLLHPSHRNREVTKAMNRKGFESPILVQKIDSIPIPAVLDEKDRKVYVKPVGRSKKEKAK